MAMKGYSTLSRALELEPHHQKQFLGGRLNPLQMIELAYFKIPELSKHRYCTHFCAGFFCISTVSLHYIWVSLIVIFYTSNILLFSVHLVFVFVLSPVYHVENQVILIVKKR